MTDNVLPFDQALDHVLTHARTVPQPPSLEAVPLLDSLHRVLAQQVTADRDQPPFDRATRDGYAVLSAVLTATRTLTLIGSIRAGESWHGPALTPGNAIEIMTGAPMPSGADAVLMVEHATLSSTTLNISEGRTLRPGENVVPRAAEARTGASLLPTGRKLEAAEIAVAASCGLTNLSVFTHPRVAIIATGDELVELHEQPAASQIRNSNSYALAALVHAEGGEPTRLPIARDTLEDLRARIAEGRTADLLLLSGGVSMGKFDLVEQVLTELNAEFFFTGALIQPGKPIVFGRLPKTTGGFTYFFGLPGNPVSTQVCFHLFVAPLLRALAGRTDIAPRFVEATLTAAVKGGTRVTRFLPAELTSTWNAVTVEVVGWQGSGDVAANARGNCYAVLPANIEAFFAGETVRVLLR